jgi:hypothetical protein
LSILKSAGGAFSRAGCVATNIPATTTNNAVMRAVRAEANLVAEVEEVADRARQRVPDRSERTLADDDQHADLASIEEGAGAGEKGEAWCGEVRHPAREEHAEGWTAGRHASVDSDVVDCHEDHDDPAGDVERDDALGAALGTGMESGETRVACRDAHARLRPRTAQYVESGRRPQCGLDLAGNGPHLN